MIRPLLFGDSTVKKYRLSNGSFGKGNGCHFTQSGVVTNTNNGPGVRCEVAVCLQTGDIVWTNGPFPCGKWPDKKTFEHKLINKLDNNEMTETDGTHSGMPCECMVPGDWLNEADRVAKADARAQQETITRQFKQFNCLGHRHRHDLKHHGMTFKACAVCIQLSIERGEMNWDINC